MKDFFAAIGRGDKKSLLTLVAEKIDWIIPGKDWPLAGTYRGIRDWHICSRRQQGRSKRPRNRASSSRKATGSWPSALRREGSRPRTRRSRKTRFSQLLSGVPNRPASGSMQVPPCRFRPCVSAQCHAICYKPALVFENRVPITSLLLMSAIDNAGRRLER